MTDLFLTPANRQEELEKLCSSARPGFGYATVAQLIAQLGPKLNVVLTTNFDDLLADAMYLFTDSRPMVIQHGALSSFIRPTQSRPIIVKLHGHHQFAPLNTVDETNRIADGMSQGVRALLHDRGLIVIGYSGNDEGVRQVLSQLPAEALPFGVFWIGKQLPIGPLSEWLTERNTIHVKHRDFDELMIHFRDVFSVAMPTISTLRRDFDLVSSTYTQLSARVKSFVDHSPSGEALRAATERVDRTVTDWGVYELRAQKYKRTDSAMARSAYEDGLQQLPDEPALHGNFANFLADLDDLDEAELHYQRALTLDPENSQIHHDYGIMLWKNLGSADRAFDQLQLAVEIDQRTSNLDPRRLTTYANFCWTERDLYDLAEECYAEAVILPNCPYETFGNYGVFAVRIRRDRRLAAELFQSALDRKVDDPVSMTNLASMALSLGDLSTGATMIERALAVDDESISNVCKCAILLWRFRIDPPRAKELYHQLGRSPSEIYVDPQERIGYLLDFARYLAEVEQDLAGARDRLTEAAALAPDSHAVAKESALFAWRFEKDPSRAITMLNEAIELLGSSNDLVGARAILLSQDVNRMQEAITIYRELLDLDPMSEVLALNLAGLLYLRDGDGDRQEASSICRKVWKRLGLLEPDAAIECLFYLYAHGPLDDRPRILWALKRSMAMGLRSPGWNLDHNVVKAVQDGHDDSEWLQPLADVLCNGKDSAILDAWENWRSVDTDAS